tara:strand:- start:997 stop:2142 length:1146 start_codon:yes stop_codon:yes gene_type:complete
MANKKEKPWYERAWDWRTENIRDPIRSTEVGGAWGNLLDDTLFAPINYFAEEGSEGIKDWAQDAPVKWWQSYDDTPQGKKDRLKDLIVDMPAHGIYRAAQWIHDLGTQGGEAALNLAKGKPLLTKEQRMKLDAWEGNPFGNYYVDEKGNVDNPYINPVYDKDGNFTGQYNNQAFLKMQARAEKEAHKKFNKEIFTPEVEKKLYAEVDEAMPFSAWSRNNKDRPQSEYQKDKKAYYDQLLSERYDDIVGDFYMEDMDRSFMEDYGIGYTDDEGRRVGDKSAFSDWDWSFEEGNWRPPHSMFGYNTDDKRFLRQMEIIPEIATDIFLTKGALAGAKAGIKEGVERTSRGLGIQIPPGRKLYEKAQKESLFDKAREWKFRRRGE